MSNRNKMGMRMKKILLVVPLVLPLLAVSLSTNAIAQVASTKFTSLEALKVYLQGVALGQNRGKLLCNTLTKGGKWYDKSGNSIQSSVLNIKTSDLASQADAWSNQNLKVTATNANMKVPVCINVQAETTGQSYGIEKNTSNVHSSSASSSITNDIKIEASVGASAGFVSANLSVGYSNSVTNGTSTSSSSGSGESTKVTVPFTYVPADGPYSVHFMVNKYEYYGKAPIDVTYMVDSLTITSSCAWESSKGHWDGLYPTTTIPIADLLGEGGETSFKIPTQVTFDVDYVDQWPSYSIVKGKMCNGNNF